ncbi:MAG: substrate-binding domain-containing protein [Coriobacteriia bacterium]|nr:substrate-binding domain-containing protein [Coriobacteriia bacterium]
MKLSALVRGTWKSVWVLCLMVVLAVVVGTGCTSADEGGEDSTADAPVETSKVVLASTTSTQDSGLFDEVIPAFEAAFPEYEVEVVAVGTGAALELGRNADADVLLVHAKASEEEFVAEGYGIERRDVMYNDFVIVGPADDPAGVAEAESAIAALETVADSGEEFVSRGDDSGTHKKELAIWEEAGIEPAGDWYVEAGQGMGDVLTMSSEREAYTMTDRATFLAMQDVLELEMLFEGDEILFNEYGVIPVTDAANAEGAGVFADWITSTEAQDLIGEFGVEEYGEPLFVPNA